MRLAPLKNNAMMFSSGPREWRWTRLGVPTILFFSVLFQEVDQWSFDVFAFHKATGDHALKFLVYDLLTRYDLINRFRVHTAFSVVATVLEVTNQAWGSRSHQPRVVSVNAHWLAVQVSSKWLMIQMDEAHWLGRRCWLMPNQPRLSVICNNVTSSSDSDQ